jgi:hypothetical protein
MELRCIVNLTTSIYCQKKKLNLENSYDTTFVWLSTVLTGTFWQLHQSIARKKKNLENSNNTTIVRLSTVLTRLVWQLQTPTAALVLKQNQLRSTTFNVMGSLWYPRLHVHKALTKITNFMPHHLE